MGAVRVVEEVKMGLLREEVVALGMLEVDRRPRLQTPVRPVELGPWKEEVGHYSGMGRSHRHHH